MTSPPSETQSEDDARLAALITDYCTNPRTWHDRIRLQKKINIRSLCDFGFAILHGNDPELALLRHQPWGPADRFVLSCLLWCSAQIECSFKVVEYIVEKLNFSIIDALMNGEFKYTTGENVVHIAIVNGRVDVVDCLVAPWARKPVRTPSL